MVILYSISNGEWGVREFHYNSSYSSAYPSNSADCNVNLVTVLPSHLSSMDLSETVAMTLYET